MDIRGIASFELRPKDERSCHAKSHRNNVQGKASRKGPVEVWVQKVDLCVCRNVGEERKAGTVCCK